MLELGFVVGIADVHGIMTNPDGLDVERPLLTRDATGGLDRSQLRAGDAQLPGDQWLAVPAEVLVPAACPAVIDESNHHAVHARLSSRLPTCPSP